MISIIELDEFIISNFIFYSYEILLDENEINLELNSKSDKSKLIEYLESEYENKYEIISDAYDELYLVIRFKDNISYIDENELLDEIKSENEYTDSLIKNSGILNEIESEYKDRLL